MPKLVSTVEWRGAKQGGIAKCFNAEVRDLSGDGQEDNVLRFVISTNTVDRYGDTIDAKGWDTKNYERNPVVLWAHNHSMPPVAQALKVWAEDNQLMADALFTPEEVYAFGHTVYLLHKGNFLRATSVGFLPTKWQLVDTDERMGYNFLEQELLEFSSVPIPANPEALQLAAKSGIKISPVVDWCSEVLDDPSKHSPIKSMVESLWKSSGRPTLVTMKSIDDPTVGEIDRGAISYSQAHSGGTSVSDGDWDAAKEVAAAEVSDLKVMCAWVDSEDSDNKSAYKLPHHKAGEGHPMVKAGLYAAMAALNGARGGVNIPDDDRKGVYNHLAKHYRDDLKEEPPELKHVEAQVLRNYPDLFTFRDGQIKVATAMEVVEDSLHDLIAEFAEFKYKLFHMLGLEDEVMPREGFSYVRAGLDQVYSELGTILRKDVEESDDLRQPADEAKDADLEEKEEAETAQTEERELAKMIGEALKSALNRN